MQVITAWSDIKALTAPQALIDALLDHLIEPFADEGTARAFWASYSSVIFFFDSTDSVESVNSLGTTQRIQVEFALSFPEYRDALIEGYFIQLAIMNDEGAGVYLVIPESSELLSYKPGAQS